MTKEEIKEAIREAKLKPTDLFEELEIVNSEPAAEARKKERAYGERQLKLLNEEHEKFIDLEKKHNEAVGKVKTLTEKVNSSTSRSLIDGSVAARKLDAKEKAFIEKNIGAFKSDKEGEDLKQDVERFVDGQLKEFVDTAKLFGVEVKKEGAAGTPNADGKGGATTPEELEDPAKNDFIPAM